MPILDKITDADNDKLNYEWETVQSSHVTWRVRISF